MERKSEETIKLKENYHVLLILHAGAKEQQQADVSSI